MISFTLKAAGNEESVIQVKLSYFINFIQISNLRALIKVQWIDWIFFRIEQKRERDKNHQKIVMKWRPTY